METLYITQKGFEKLLARKQEYLDRLRVIQSQKGPAIEAGTWHDNFEFEELVRQETATTGVISDISKEIEMSKVVSDKPADTKTLQIGHVAVLYIEENDETKEILVCGHGETDLTATPQQVAYGAPLLKPFFGHEPGHESTIQFGDKKKRVLLEDIKMRS